MPRCTICSLNLPLPTPVSIPIDWQLVRGWRATFESVRLAPHHHRKIPFGKEIKHGSLT